MKFFKKSTTKAGFTLLELLITLGIFVIITTLVLANDRRFGNTVNITSLAYDVALSVREAQTYGFAVKGSSNTFNNYYGIHVDMGNLPSYLIFVDLPSGTLPNGKYDGATELVKSYNLNNGFKIKD